MSGKNRRSRKGIYLIGGGLLLIAAALCLVIFNMADSWRAGWESSRILAEMEIGETVEFLEKENGEEEGTVPVISVDGNFYIGVLELPDRGLELPVMEEWSYPNLRIAPCRYKGTAQDGDLIIAGHNYDRHFGCLRNLEEGELVRFTDVKGGVHEYQVQEVEILGSTAIQEMEAGEWDLTLFTCTVGGQMRVAARCTEVFR